MKKIVVNPDYHSNVNKTRAQKKIVMASQDGYVLMYEEPVIKNYIFPGGEATDSCKDILEKWNIPIPYMIPEKFLEIICYSKRFTSVNSKLLKQYYQTIKDFYLFLTENKQNLPCDLPKQYIFGQNEGTYYPKLIFMNDLYDISMVGYTPAGTNSVYNELNEKMEYKYKK